MNSKQAQSRRISRAKMLDMIAAAEFAWWKELPLNRSLTFNLSKCEMRPQDFISAFTKLAGDWLRVSGVGLAYIWVLEHPDNSILNLHILIHVPEKLVSAFSRKERSWMKQAGLPWQDDRRLRAQKIGRKPGENRYRQISDGGYIINLEGALGYMMKGGDPMSCEALLIKHECQGTVKGKRLGISQSINRGAQKRRGFRLTESVRSALIFSRRGLLLPSK